MLGTHVKKILFSAQSIVIYTKDYIKTTVQRYDVVGTGLRIQQGTRQRGKEILTINNKNGWKLWDTVPKLNRFLWREIICIFIAHYLEAMGCVQDPWVQLKLLRGLEKTVFIIHAPGPALIDTSRRTPGGIWSCWAKESCLAIAQWAHYRPVLKRRHISEEKQGVALNSNGGREHGWESCQRPKKQRSSVERTSISLDYPESITRADLIGREIKNKMPRNFGKFVFLKHWGLRAQLSGGVLDQQYVIPSSVPRTAKNTGSRGCDSVDTVLV